MFWVITCIYLANQGYICWNSLDIYIQSIGAIVKRCNHSINLSSLVNPSQIVDIITEIK
jgi:hypothetical protein